MFQASSPNMMFGEHQGKFIKAAGKFEDLVNRFNSEAPGDSSDESALEYNDPKLVLHENDFNNLLGMVRSMIGILSSMIAVEVLAVMLRSESVAKGTGRVLRPFKKSLEEHQRTLWEIKTSAEFNSTLLTVKRIRDYLNGISSPSNQLNFVSDTQSSRLFSNLSHSASANHASANDAGVERYQTGFGISKSQ